MFKNYCVVIIGSTEDSEKDVLGIADSNVSSFMGGGLCIHTFTSAVNVTELSDWFKSHDRNYLVFELSEKTSGFNIKIKEIHDKLFGFLNEQKLLELNSKFEETIEDEEIDFIDLNPVESEETIKTFIDSMTDLDKKSMINELLDKSELSEKDKIILQYLVK